MPVIGFPNGKSPKHYLVKAKLPILNEIGRCEPCGKQTCLVRDSISTATTFRAEAYQDTFNIQGGPSNCDYEKDLYLSKCKVCLKIINLNILRLERVIGENQKLFHTHCCLMTIAALNIGIL